MKKLLMMIVLVSGAAKADMFYECKKQSETKPVNAVSSAPKSVEMYLAENFALFLNGKEVKFKIIDEVRDYRPILQTEREHLGEVEIASYYFDGHKCHSHQTGTLTRIAQLGAPDVTEIAEYTCECGEG